MAKISLADQVAALRILGSLQELIDSDKIWTGFLQSASKIRSQDREPILELSKRMDRLLSMVPDAVLALQPIVKKASKESTGYPDFFRNAPAQTQKWIEGWIAAEGGISGAFRVYSVRTRDAVASERKLLGEKRKLIVKGKFTTGDVTEGFICDVVKIVLVIAILTQNEFAFHWATGQAIQSKC